MPYYAFPNGEVHEFHHEAHDPQARKITKAEFLRMRPEYCRAQLLKIIKPGQTVFTILRSVSKSGMSRVISLYVPDGADMRNIDTLASDLCGWKQSDSGIKVPGCGMDMGFHLVYKLGHALWPNGTPKPHGTRNGVPDQSGGYAIKHSWL